MSENILYSEWFNVAGLRSVINALSDADGGPRIVGGAVRDSLLGLSVSDVDLATKLVPTEVIRRLEGAGIKSVPTGIEHGTVTAVSDGKNYEITTLRRDVATDGRRAVVAFSSDWKDDAARRDFTINALYADAHSGEVYDYFSGLPDLEQGIVRFIGDADQRIAEDYLRILRYFRFFARFGKGDADPDAIAACAKGVHGLTALSRERIAQELTRLISLANPTLSMKLMVDHQIFAPFLPELDASAAERMASIVDREVAHSLPVSLPARLLTLLPREAAVVDRVSARLKMSNRLREQLAHRVTGELPSEVNIREIAYRKGIGCATDAATLYANSIEFELCLARLVNWDVPTFGIRGGDVIAMGVPAGPMVAKTLQAIEQAWISDDFPAIDNFLSKSRQIVGALLSATKKA
ncbi:MAG: polynucleotide adenylyltransferase [Sphingopyxis sp.]|nr:polynucleotide adenylyltransferase [Sphingopyxis sp.]